MLQGSTSHPLPPQGLFRVQRVYRYTWNVQSEQFRWTKLIFEAIAAKSTKVFPSRHWAALLMDTSTRTGAPTIRAHHTSPSAGSKARSSQSSCTSWLLWDPWHSAGNQPAEEAAVVSVPAQSTDKWLMGNACFMLEQMAFLWPVCVKYTGTQITCHKSTLYYK